MPSEIIIPIFDELRCQIQNSAKNDEVVIVNYLLLHTGRCVKINQVTAPREKFPYVSWKQKIQIS